MAPTLTQQLPQRTPAMQGGLLGQTPAQARADAFLAGLGGMGAGLLQAGATTTDPTQFGRGMANAAQGFTQGRQSSLQNTRAQEAQKRQMALANAKAAREQQIFEMEMNRNKNLMQALRGSQSPRPVSNAMSGPEPTAVSPLMQRPQSSGSSQINGVSYPNAIIKAAMISKNPAEVLARFAQTANDPSKMYGPNNVLNAEGRVNLERQARTELKPVLEATQSVNQKMRNVQTGLSDKTGTGDIAAVKQFIKMVDDGVVTAGELAVERSAQDLMSYIRGTVANLAEGTVLDTKLRKNILNLALRFEQNTYASIRPQVLAAKIGADELGLRWDTQIWRGGPNIFGTAIPDKTLKKPKINIVPPSLGDVGTIPISGLVPVPISN